MKSTRSLYTTFSEIFPPPRFLEMPSVGLDISNHTVRFVELKHHGAEFRLGKFGAEKIPVGIVDEDGYIVDKLRLTAVLLSIKRKYKLHFIRASLPEEKSYLFKTEIPVMDERDIRSAIGFKIEENVPVALADAVYDFRIIRPPEPNEKTMGISVTVVHTKVISSYIDTFVSAGLAPLSLQTESQAIAHAALPKDANETYILIAIRGSRTLLSLVSERAVQFTSTLHIGGEAIADSIKKNLSIDEKEVEKIRQGKEVRDSNEMFLSLVSAADALRDEVQKLVAFWDSHSLEHGKSKIIHSIIISGSDALLGLDDYLSRSLDIEVKIANPWTNILTLNDNVPPLTLRDALDFMPALGLALPYD